MKRFSLRLSEQEHRAIAGYANFWDVSVNDAIREAIRTLIGNPRGIEPLDSPAILPHPASGAILQGNNSSANIASEDGD